MKTIKTRQHILSHSKPMALCKLKQHYGLWTLWALSFDSNIQTFFQAFDTIFWWIVGISFYVWSTSNWSKSSARFTVFKDMLANLFNSCFIAWKNASLLLLLKTNIFLIQILKAKLHREWGCLIFTNPKVNLPVMMVMIRMSQKWAGVNLVSWQTSLLLLNRQNIILCPLFQRNGNGNGNGK